MKKIYTLLLAAFIRVATTLLLFNTHSSSAQTLQWAKAMGGVNLDEGRAIAVDSSGNVYTTGHFQGTADFDPGPGTFNLTSTVGGENFISKLDGAGNFVWVKQTGGSSAYSYSYSIAVDGIGNVYTTGYFQYTCDFDPGAGTFYLTSAGAYDIFVNKLDASGNFLWAKAMGGSSDDYGYSIAVDGIGNVYSTGTFKGTSDFDPGAGTFNISSAGLEDIFVSKLDTSGNFLWAKKFGGTNLDYVSSIAVDMNGNVYTTGHFEDTVDFDPGTGTFNLTSKGGTDIFVSKLDISGNFVWVKTFGGTCFESPRSIAVDGSGNVYTTGEFCDTVDFDSGAGIFNLISAGAHDIFISKLNASGNYIWAKAMGGTGSDFALSIAVDGSGNVYTTGNFYATVDFDPGVGTFNLSSAGNSDIFISKLGASGNFIWAKQDVGNSYEDGLSIAVDLSENAYFTGYFAGTVDFDPGVGTLNITSAGSSDIFIAKYIQRGVTGYIFNETLNPPSKTVVMF